jgi:hypothetical protein
MKGADLYLPLGTLLGFEPHFFSVAPRSRFGALGAPTIHAPQYIVHLPRKIRLLIRRVTKLLSDQKIRKHASPKFNHLQRSIIIVVFNISPDIFVELSNEKTRSNVSITPVTFCLFMNFDDSRILFTCLHR